MCPIIPQMGSRPHHANKKAGNKSHLLFYGAHGGTLHELFDNILFPIFSSKESLLLDSLIIEYKKCA